MNAKLIKPADAQVAVYGAPLPAAPLPYPAERQQNIPAQVWEMAKRRKWTLLLGLVSVVAVTAFITSRMPRVFDSQATILVGTGSNATNAPTIDVITTQAGLFNSIETELQLLESRRIVEPVVDGHDLHVGLLSPAGKRPADVLPGFTAERDATPATYTLAKAKSGGLELHRTAPTDTLLGSYAPGQRVAAAGIAFTVPPTLPEEDVVVQVNSFQGAVYGVMGRVTALAESENGSLVTVHCAAGSPPVAQLICREISESYVALRNELQRGDASHAAEFIYEQSDTVATQLATAEKELQAFKEKHQVSVTPEAQANQDLSEFATLQSQRDQLEAERSALRGFLSRVEAGSGTDRYRQLAAFPTFINNPMVGDIVHNLMTYENQLALLSERRTENNPEVVALRERMSDLEGQLGGMARNYESALSGQISSLDRPLGRYRGRLSTVPQTEIGLARLQRRVDLLTQLYTSLQEKLGEARIAEAVELADVSVIDPASLPLEPSSPDVKKNLALAVVAGLLLGLGASLAQEFADTRLRRRGDVERETGLPVLTLVPSVRGSRLALGGPKLLGRARPEPHSALRDFYPAGDERVVEAFRALGADLAFMGQTEQEETPRTVVFTSPQRGDGKTFSAVNYAATRALQGYRTLLIDADLRAGAAGTLVGLNGGLGLSDVLSGDVRLLDAVRMVKVGDHRLAVLGAGTPKPDALNLLGGEKVEELLATAAVNFEQVVIDTPPLSLLSDAALLAARADAVMLVVRAGKTDQEAVDVTLSRLARVGARTIGVVLNDVDLPEDVYPRSAYASASN